MKKIIAALIIFILVVPLFSCGNKVEETTTIPTQKETMGAIFFQRPTSWVISDDENEFSLILESRKTDPNPSVVVVTLISGMNMSAMDYANIVHESLENTTEPTTETFGENDFAALKITQNITTWNYFLSNGKDVYSFTYSNLEGKIVEELKMILSSTVFSGEPQP